ncbi:MAG: hypothetical protein HDR39_05820 [Treponema sp.]|nr:hypothetical protein [Treponema sp.]MBD5447624.1 hypothetical protein [Treponema sp.]
MTRYAILVGAVDLSEGMQKSLVDFKDFLTSSEGGSWREEEIMVCGSMDWQFVQLLQSRLREYDFVLVYQCRFSHGDANSDWSGKLRCVTEGGRGVFIGDVCDEVVSMVELGYERVETARWTGDGL